MEKSILTTYNAEELQSLIVAAVKKANSSASNQIDTYEINDDYLSQYEATKFLRISRPTIIRWKKEKKIPYYQKGRKILYRKSELLKVMHKNDSLLR